MSDCSLPIPPNPSSSREPCEYVAVLGSDSHDHLYRGVSSPHPIGVVVETLREEALGSIHRVSLMTPWGETIMGMGVVHWSTPIGTHGFRLGLRFVNPSQAFSRALLRITEQFPTRLFDERQEQPSTEAPESNECPSTRRCSAPCAAPAAVTDPWFLWGFHSWVRAQ